MIKLSKEIEKALDIMGYHTLNEVQKQVIPLFLEHKNIVVQSNTGSGKTAAYAIPLCEMIDWENLNVQVLVLTCTRELSVQVKEEFSHIGKFKKIKATAIYGKEKMSYQVNALQQKCHVVSATPGRLIDHINRGSIDLSQVSYVVIDEADYMLDLGFNEQVKEILAYLSQDVKKALFSATYPEKIHDLIEQFFAPYEFLNLSGQLKIKHMFVETNDTDEALIDTLDSIQAESVIIFCERKDEVDDVCLTLKDQGFKHVKIHGDIFQEKRFENLKKFKSGQVRILVASDVAARGIDIDKVSHVIHYGLPSNKFDYVHRSGRTGRINETGNSIVLIKDRKELQVLPDYKWEKFVEEDTSDLNTRIAKKNISKQFETAVEKIYLNAGKEKGVRTLDIIGAFTSIEGVNQDDIGVVEVLNRISYIEIFNGKAQYIVDQMKNKTIKKKKIRVEIAK